MRKVAYFRDGNNFLGVTNESPKGLNNLVYVGRGPQPGKGIESVREQAYARNQLNKMERIKAEDVPDDWFEAIGLEKTACCRTQRPSCRCDGFLPMPAEV